MKRLRKVRSTIERLMNQDFIDALLWKLYVPMMVFCFFFSSTVSFVEITGLMRRSDRGQDVPMIGICIATGTLIFALWSLYVLVDIRMKKWKRFKCGFCNEPKTRDELYEWTEVVGRWCEACIMQELHRRQRERIEEIETVARLMIAEAERRK